MFEVKNLVYKKILSIPYLRIDQPITCIVGASGSGKTTLLRHFNRLYEPDEGEIYYQGQLLSAIDPILLRRRVVMLGQTPVIYDGTIGNNVQIGRIFAQKPPAPQEHILEMLKRAGLRHAPESWCDKLSGGEKQRLCLARVMLMDAETYLLDEPSASLDQDSERFILESLCTFVRDRNKELIIVTHSPQIAAMFPDSCIKLENGRTEGYA